jgi:hypothetical protein
MGQLFLFFTTLTVQFSTTTPQSIGLQTVGIKKFQVVTALAFFLSFCLGKRTKTICPNDGSHTL